MNTQTSNRTRFVVARTDEIKPGQRKLADVGGRAVAIFNLNGDYFALGDRCPHEGGSLCAGKVVGLAEADEPGRYRLSRPGEFVKCPWHGWEFDIRTGESFCEPGAVKVRRYDASVEHGEELIKGPFKAETYEVSVEEDYVVIHL